MLSSVPSDSFVRLFVRSYSSRLCECAHAVNHTHWMCERLRRPYHRQAGFYLLPLSAIGNACVRRSFVRVRFSSPSVDESSLARARARVMVVCVPIFARWLHSFSFRMRHHQSEARPLQTLLYSSKLLLLYASLALNSNVHHVGGVVLVLCVAVGLYVHEMYIYTHAKIHTSI